MYTINVISSTISLIIALLFFVISFDETDVNKKIDLKTSAIFFLVSSYGCMQADKKPE